MPMLFITLSWGLKRLVLRDPLAHHNPADQGLGARHRGGGVVADELAGEAVAGGGGRLVEGWR